MVEIRMDHDGHNLASALIEALTLVGVRSNQLVSARAQTAPAI
jgi:hypothetical protein